MYKGTEQGGILSGYFTRFILLLTRKGLEQYPHSLKLANIGLELLPADTPKSILEAQYILINLKTRGFGFLEKIQLYQLEMLVD